MGSSNRIPKRNSWTRHPWPPGVLDGFWAPLVSGGIILLAGERLWIFSSPATPGATLPFVGQQSGLPAQPGVLV